MARHRQTSAETYRDLECKGVLAGQRLEIFRAFQRHGEGTSAEVLKFAHLDQNRNLARARVTELANDGHLVEVDERPCKVTGRRAIVWRAVGDDEQPVRRARPVRVELTIDDVDAVAKFLSGERGAYCPNLDRVHRKILDALPKERPVRR